MWALTEQMLRQCDRRGVFALKEGEYVREHCSVHVQRANMQSKHKNFADPQLAGQLNA